jgi:hypothetical protein
VDCVFELHVVVEPFLQKRFPVHVVLAHRGRLPREVSSGRIALCVKKEKKNYFEWLGKTIIYLSIRSVYYKALSREVLIIWHVKKIFILFRSRGWDFTTSDLSVHISRIALFFRCLNKILSLKRLITYTISVKGFNLYLTNASKSFSRWLPGKVLAFLPPPCCLRP